jgi:DNA repair exonuclease SbcCD ATPase subunit
MSEMEHHLEHAEHAQHAAHDPFDRRVTMTIAIIAAMLACVTLLSHRAHNETLQLQIEASSFITKAADKWNQYQAKKNRRYQYEASIEMVRVLAKDPSQKYQDEIAAWKGKVETYKKDADDLQEEARELDRNAEEHKKLSEHIHHIGDRYDLGELGVEIGLVLCSIAVLTKRAGFWYAGMGAAGLGAVLAAIGVYGQYFHFH